MCGCIASFLSIFTPQMPWQAAIVQHPSKPSIGLDVLSGTMV